MLELNEQGIYEIRSRERARAPRSHRGQPRPGRIRPDAARPAASWWRGDRPRGPATAETAPTAPAELTPEEAEKRQALWWYLLVAGLLLLAAEMVVANTLSRKSASSNTPRCISVREKTDMSDGFVAADRRS